MGGHARQYFKHGRALPAHNGNFDAYVYYYSQWVVKLCLILQGVRNHEKLRTTGI